MLTRPGDEENQTLLASHSKIICQQLDIYGGLEVKTTGDGFMIAFYSARKAVSCAVEVQKDLQEFNRQNPDRQLKVRIGLNLGEVIKEEEDYFGSAVVMTARIMDESTGGRYGFPTCCDRSLTARQTRSMSTLISGIGPLRGSRTRSPSSKYCGRLARHSRRASSLRATSGPKCQEVGKRPILL